METHIVFHVVYPLAPARFVARRGYLVVQRGSSSVGYAIGLYSIQVWRASTPLLHGEPVRFEKVERRGLHHLALEGYDVVPYRGEGLAALREMVARGEASGVLEEYRCQVSSQHLSLDCGGFRVRFVAYTGGGRIDVYVRRGSVRVVPVPALGGASPGLEVAASTPEALRDAAEFVAAAAEEAARAAGAAAGGGGWARRVILWPRRMVLTVPVETRVPVPARLDSVEVSLKPGRDVVDYFVHATVDEAAPLRLRVSDAVVGAGSSRLGAVTVVPDLLRPLGRAILFPTSPRSGYHQVDIEEIGELSEEELLERLLTEAAGATGGAPASRMGLEILSWRRGLKIEWWPAESRPRVYTAKIEGMVPYVEAPPGELSVSIRLDRSAAAETIREAVERIDRVQRRVARLLEA